MKQPLHRRGGHATKGMTLRELEDMVAQANELGFDKDKTRVCTHLQRPKGLIDVYFVEEA
jgi:hypothetical protein